jgi:hypothetical protein
MKIGLFDFDSLILWRMVRRVSLLLAEGDM